MAIRTAPKKSPYIIIDESPPAPTAETLRYIENRIGRPPSGKVVVSIRLDRDVIAAFRATGPGWQARINEALKASLTLP